MERSYPEDGGDLFQRLAPSVGVTEDHQQCSEATGDDEAEIISPSDIPRKVG